MYMYMYMHAHEIKDVDLFELVSSDVQYMRVVSNEKHWSTGAVLDGTKTCDHQVYRLM